MIFITIRVNGWKIAGLLRQPDRQEIFIFKRRSGFFVRKEEVLKSLPLGMQIMHETFSYS